MSRHTHSAATKGALRLKPRGALYTLTVTLWTTFACQVLVIIGGGL